jgi:hypothetical protein
MLFAVGLDGPQEAQAGAFATEITQLLNHAQLIMQYLRQAQQLEQAIKQLADMVKNSRTLPNQVFGPITADLSALAAIVQADKLCRTRWRTSIPFSRRGSLATAIQELATSPSTAVGRKPPWIRLWVRCGLQDCRASNFRASSPFLTHSVRWLRQATAGWKLFK